MSDGTHLTDGAAVTTISGETVVDERAVVSLWEGIGLARGMEWSLELPTA
jgi:hypothetical protein